MSSDISPEVSFRDPLPASGIIPAPSVSSRFRKTLFPATPAFILSISRRFRSRKRVQKYSLFPDPQTNTGIFLGNFYELFIKHLFFNRLWTKDFQEKERGRKGGTPYTLSRTREKGKRVVYRTHRKQPVSRVRRSLLHACRPSSARVRRIRFTRAPDRGAGTAF